MSDISPSEEPIPPTTHVLDTSEELVLDTNLPDAEPELTYEEIPDIEEGEEEVQPVVPPEGPPLSVLNDLLFAFRQLARDFETKLKYDASKKELIDKLYKENLEFKEGIVRKFQHVMILAVIEKIDEAEKDIAVFANRESSEENYRKLLDSYRDIAANFQDMLSIRFDVESYRCEPLTAFEPKIQRSLRTCPTVEGDKNKLVKQTLRPGYKTADGFILRPELVEVYVFDEK